MAQRHAHTYGNQVWLTSYIPEEVLYAAGLIHNFNRLRQERLRQSRESKGKAVLFSDYGLDFLAKRTHEDGTVTYHAGQAKHYTSKRVRAADIATFLLQATAVLQSVGYLYATSALQVDLREALMLMRSRPIHITHHRVTDFAAPCAAPQPEMDLQLRPAQEEAVAAALGRQGRLAWHMCCGFGKTLVLGHLLHRAQHGLVVCIAPLKISVRNLYDRILPFLPGYRVLLVDSDAGGTTDVEEVQGDLKQEGPLILFSTYESAENVLAPALGDLAQTAFLAVDEVHNMLGREGLYQFYHSFSNSIVLSATIPEELYEDLEDLESAYTYSIADSIRDKCVCDYQVLLPYLEGCEVPDELPKNDMTVKALFLVTAMLNTGSRRCIGYFRSREECDLFLETLGAVASDYHGLRLWARKIVSETPDKHRQQILSDFQADQGYDVHVIASVRILDEAVDIPRCDMEFVSYACEDTIRLVQRLMRGNRLDPLNPWKVNHLAFYADDWSAATGALSMLKEADPEFHRKVRVLDADYGRQGDPDPRARVANKSTELQQHVIVGCMSLQERWKLRRQEWAQQYMRLGREPLARANDVAERRAGCWQNRTRKAYKAGKLSQEQVRALEETPGWGWGVRGSTTTFEEQHQHWVATYEKLGQKLPSVTPNDEAERRAGQWQHDIRMAYKAGKLSHERLMALEMTPGWEWGVTRLTFEELHQHWVGVYERLGQKQPSRSSSDEAEKRAGQWQNRMRKSYRNNKLSKERITALEGTPGWKWSAK